MEVLDKVTIQTWTLPHSSVGERGKSTGVEPAALLEAILYKLKTGYQHRQLPVEQSFEGDGLARQNVYYHFTEWRKNGSWKRVWWDILRLNKRFSITPASS